MPLIAYNLTTTALTLAGGSPAPVLPASTGTGVRGPGVNVTSELRGIGGTAYAAIDVQRAAASVAFAWTGTPEYATPGLVLGGNAVLSGSVRLTAPIAAELISIVADVSLAAGALTIAAQPDYPRKLQVRITDANSSITAGTVTLVGLGASGQAVTQVIPLTGGTATVVSADAYSHLTSATVAALAGNAAADHVSIGVGAAFGLPAVQGATGFAVHKANADNADEAVGTVDAVAGTLAPTTAANATHNYTFFYSYNFVPALV
jgi:hypothetical protein